MENRQRLARIIARGRRAYRAHHAMRGALALGIAAATAAFLTLLLTGLGFLDAQAWRLVATAAAGAVLLGALGGLLRPLTDVGVLARLDADHGLRNALATTRELLQGTTAMTDMATAHVRQSLGQAEQLGLARTVTADLGGHARILGILCLCIVSVALI